MSACADAGVEALLARLAAEPAHGEAWELLIPRLTVRESYFFRDAPLLAALLPALIEERRAAGDRRLVLWSAGCAAGEEPYSLAMVLAGLLGDREEWTLTILATDVDATALAAARRGRYTEWALRETPAWARERYFRRRDSRNYELDAEIRAMVSFAPLNLATDPYPGGVDVILCRNVLMYFTAAARRRAVGRLASALAPGGRLVLSPLDVPPHEHRELDAVEEAGCRLYRRRPVQPTREPDAPERVVEPPLARAREEADHGRLDAARALCREALRRDPLDPEAHLLLAAVEEEGGDPGAAIAALRRAVYAAPDSATAHFRLGGLLLRTGDREPGRRSLAAAAGLLVAAPPDAPVPGADGTTAGTLLAAVRAHLEPTS